MREQEESFSFITVETMLINLVKMLHKVVDHRLPLATDSAGSLASLLVLRDGSLRRRLGGHLLRRLLLVSVGLLLRLGGVDGGITLSLAHLWLDGLLGLDLSPRLTGNATLRLERTSRSLSRVDLSHGTLLVLAAVEDGPGNLSRVLLGFQQLLRLAVDEDDLLAIEAHVALSMSWVDLETR